MYSLPKARERAAEPILRFWTVAAPINQSRHWHVTLLCLMEQLAFRLIMVAQFP
jgi:hypothetical protein